jgi:hypothetical protein
LRTKPTRLAVFAGLKLRLAFWPVLKNSGKLMFFGSGLQPRIAPIVLNTDWTVTPSTSCP